MSPGFSLNQRGQLVVEYVLLLLVVVIIAGAVRKILTGVGENPGDSGAVMSAWDTMEQQIACDNPNSTSGPACYKASH